MIIAKVIQSAIDEKLKLQEAERQGIEISDKEIDASIQNFEQNNKIPAGQLKSLLAKEGVSMKVFREQMKSDLAWIRVIRRQLMAAGNITDKEIEESINQSAKDMMTPKYMVSEIVIKKKTPRISTIWLPICAEIRVLSYTPPSFPKAPAHPTAAISAG